MKKNITITHETNLEILNKLGKEILNEMKQDFPLLRDVLIRTCGPVNIMVVFSFDYTFKNDINSLATTAKANTTLPTATEMNRAKQVQNKPTTTTPVNNVSKAA